MSPFFHIADTEPIIATSGQCDVHSSVRPNSVLCHRVSPCLPCYEPNSLIEIFSEHTNQFPFRTNSFNTDLSDVPTTIAASDVTEIHDERQLTFPLFTQETEVSANPFSTSVHKQTAASGSQQQPASSSVTNPWHMLNFGSCGKLQQSGESSVVRGCGKLQQSVDSNEKSQLKKTEIVNLEV